MIFLLDLCGIIEKKQNVGKDGTSKTGSNIGQMVFKVYPVERFVCESWRNVFPVYQLRKD